ncbi:MAG: hypothetical protein Faunusvirus8_15 [Faunusvirus sp.]|jgi:hypothetical protein|uniref:Uncharacterized protein n=1 Tax=Faunusvirus sp. TaxID=2487766 RepID=A0A3G4ZWL1_9VIRU|nr:MAG: hypothetical protein Faunusvirus8_15 [Faunusvirus sp.]
MHYVSKIANLDVSKPLDYNGILKTDIDLKFIRKMAIWKKLIIL